VATALYNTPDTPRADVESSAHVSTARTGALGMALGIGGSHHGTPMSPASPDAPILGHYKDKKKSSLSSLTKAASPSAIAAALGFSSSPPSPTKSSGGFTFDGADSPPPNVMSSDPFRANGNDYLLPPGAPHHLLKPLEPPYRISYQGSPGYPSRPSTKPSLFSETGTSETFSSANGGDIQKHQLQTPLDSDHIHVAGPEQDGAPHAGWRRD